MTHRDPSYYAGMSPEDIARSKASDENILRIAEKRRAAARALLAPPEPAEAVREAYAPLREAAKDRRTPDADR